ncbi:hypothetical protein [Sediminispirochaeta bajacaliforniensis]|uniref:hypothetical protein n=1 Tax=Sediminispirochaeta bajacaliforniensis TaxID=148 RepID=UPI00146D6C38|nr:hypothetical protein [Sediminispirochaeta bajacaliforniensis]
MKKCLSAGETWILRECCLIWALRIWFSLTSRANLKKTVDRFEKKSMMNVRKKRIRATPFYLELGDR